MWRRYAALASAIEWGASAEVVSLLLGAGADPNKMAGRQRPGFTALAEACAMDYGPRLECIRPLLLAGADTSLAWSQPRVVDGPRRTCREWVSMLNRHQVRAAPPQRAHPR